jgi:hypothetical protein
MSAAVNDYQTVAPQGRFRSEKAYSSTDIARNSTKCNFPSLNNSSVVNNLWNVTVREVVEARCPELRTRNEGDVLGNYKLPDTQAYLYKPHPFMISKTKDRDLLEKFLKDKKHQPGPTSYNLPLNTLGKKNISIYKTDKKSFVDEI